MWNRAIPIWALPVIVSVLFLSGSALGQSLDARKNDPKYGETPEQREECLKNTSFYNEYYKQKNFKDAIPGWKVVYGICPRSSENIYIRGIRMIKMAIEAEKDPLTRKALIDSMIRIYDRKIAHFKREGYNTGLKAVDLFSLDRSRSAEIARYAREAHRLDGDRVNSQAMLILMQVACDQFSRGEVKAEEVLEIYSTVSDLFVRQQAAFPTGDAYAALKPKRQKALTEEREKLTQMSESLDALFASAGVANCENLIAVYTPKFARDPENVALARSIRSQLSSLRCTDGDLFLQTSERVFESEPSATVGVEIARIFSARRQNAEADKYYKASVQAEQDSVRKAVVLVEYASFVGNTMGEMSRAKSLALEALSYNPSQGYAYMLLGSLYGSTRSCGSSKVDKASAYWAAVDKFAQAKQVQPDLAEECNKQIAYYSRLFPTSEEIFFQDYEIGKSFTVPCWINERTTIRARN